MFDCDISSARWSPCVLAPFKPLENVPAGGYLIDKSADVGALTAGRRYLQTVVANPGMSISLQHSILVSIGRGIQEKDNVAWRRRLADAMGEARAAR
jgi:electron transfer flavoprotein alpha subunit